MIINNNKCVIKLRYNRLLIVKKKKKYNVVIRFNFSLHSCFNDPFNVLYLLLVSTLKI